MTNDSRPWTGGPWGTWEHPDNNHPDWRLILGGDDSTLGEAYTEANAHLIAQAPEMYEELAELVTYLEALLEEVYKDINSPTHKYLKKRVGKAKATLTAANPQGQGGDSNG